MKTLLLYAWKDIRHDWARTLLSITGLAVLVFSYHLLGAMSASFSNFARDPGVNRNLIVIEADLIDPSEAVLEPDALAAARAYIPAQVARVSPHIFRQVRAGERIVQLRAAPLSDWEPLYRMQLLQGGWPEQPHEIACAETAARANGWTLGSRVRIYGSDFSISAIFRAQGSLFAALWMPLERAQTLYGASGRIQAMYVQAAESADIEQLRASLQANPAIASRYTVFYEDSYTLRNNQIIKDVDLLGGIAKVLALLAITFGAYNATSLSLVERAREIGCLRALGFSNTVTRLLLLTRSLLQGLLAYSLGLVLALVYIAASAGGQVSVYGVPLIFSVSPAQALSGLLWVAALAAAGAWISSRRLVGASVADLLRE